MIHFQKYNVVTKLWSQHYDGYFVICHIHNFRSPDGSCRYLLNGRCPLEKSLYSFKTIQGGTFRLERHKKTHKSGYATLNSQRNLPGVARGKAARSAAIAVCLDLRNFSFCDRHPDLRHFAKSMFELGQTVQENEKIDPESCLSGSTAITSAFKCLSSNLRQKFVVDVQNGCLRFGEANTIDGVCLRMHGKHYCNFPFQFLKISEKVPFPNVPFTLKNVIVVLVEAPDHPKAQNIESCLNEALFKKNSSTFHFFTREFIIVTDGATVLAKFAGASVSREIHLPDGTWMSCLVHFLNDVMKSVIANHCRTEISQVVLLDFCSMKKSLRMPTSILESFATAGISIFPRIRN